MNIIISDYQPHTEDEVKEFVSKSVPVENINFKLERAKEDVGWVEVYFNYNKTTFKVLLSLAISDLSSLVIFFEKIIDLKDEVAIFLDDECVSEALLYASSVDESMIRLLIADGKTIHDKWKNGETEDVEPILSQYEIKCDVIINKKKLLKEFYRAVKNIIKTFVPYEEDLFSINYENWKNNFKHIISYCEREKSNASCYKKHNKVKTQ